MLNGLARRPPSRVRHDPAPRRAVYVGAHDLQHTVQAEEALMQAFIPGTGPFRFRFADYVRA